VVECATVLTLPRGEPGCLGRDRHALIHQVLAVRPSALARRLCRSAPPPRRRRPKRQIQRLPSRDGLGAPPDSRACSLSVIPGKRRRSSTAANSPARSNAARIAAASSSETTNIDQAWKRGLPAASDASVVWASATCNAAALAAATLSAVPRGSDQEERPSPVFERSRLGRPLRMTPPGSDPASRP